MKTRKKEYGDCNMVGKNIERLRKERRIRQRDFIERIQLAGYDMNPSSYSKLEGQLKVATDKELFAIATVLGVSINELFEEK
jgi:transcriptional regulator with XRE-family HTH domain